jgi:tetratricopeptide (TPR) repeat protein
MKLRHLLCLGTIAILLFISLAIAATDPITGADELYAKRYNIENVRQAVTLLKQVQPASADSLWRLARCHWFLGEHAAKKDDILALFDQGKLYAEQAIKANDKNIQAHYWLAALLGSIGQERGILKSLAMVSPMKEQLDICLQLDPKFADGHDTLGQLYFKAPGGISIGDKKKALEHAKLAVQYNPASDHLLHLGTIAADQKEYTLARDSFNKVLALTDDPEDPEWTREHKAEAKKGLEKLPKNK